MRPHRTSAQRLSSAPLSRQRPLHQCLRLLRGLPRRGRATWRRQRADRLGHHAPSLVSRPSYQPPRRKRGRAVNGDCPWGVISGASGDPFQGLSRRSCFGPRASLRLASREDLAEDAIGGPAVSSSHRRFLPQRNFDECPNCVIALDIRDQGQDHVARYFLRHCFLPRPYQPEYAGLRTFDRAGHLETHLCETCV